VEVVNEVSGSEDAEGAEEERVNDGIEGGVDKAEGSSVRKEDVMGFESSRKGVDMEVELENLDDELCRKGWRVKEGEGRCSRAQERRKRTEHPSPLLPTPPIYLLSSRFTYLLLLLYAFSLILPTTAFTDGEEASKSGTSIFRPQGEGYVKKGTVQLLILLCSSGEDRLDRAFGEIGNGKGRVLGSGGRLGLV
jgi:hypothetical protein